MTFEVLEFTFKKPPYAVRFLALEPPITPSSKAGIPSTSFERTSYLNAIGVINWNMPYWQYPKRGIVADKRTSMQKGQT